MKHRFPKTLLLALSLASLIHGASADQLPGEAKAFQCTGCHGPHGMKSAPGQPAIGGRDPDEILALLKDYQSLHRINPAMLALLIGLRDEDLEDIAEYFSLVGEGHL